MEAIEAAAFDALVAAWRPELVFETGDVPTTAPSPHIAMSTSSGSAENYRLSAQHGSRSYRTVVQAFGKTASEVAFAVDKADSAFLDQRLVVAGFDCTPAQVEVASPLLTDPDDNVWLYKTLTYTFTAYPLEES